VHITNKATQGIANHLSGRKVVFSAPGSTRKSNYVYVYGAESGEKIDLKESTVIARTIPDVAAPTVFRNHSGAIFHHFPSHFVPSRPLSPAIHSLTVT